jgi:hypothetical protein
MDTECRTSDQTVPEPAPRWPCARDLGVFAAIGTIELLVATIGADIALRRNGGAIQPVAALLGIAGFLITAHPPPFGPIGLAPFALAAFLYVRGQTAVRVGAPLEQPEPA